MELVAPQVFFLGETSLDYVGVKAWLQNIGGDEAEACLEHIEGADVENLIELMARRCYKSFAPGLNPNVNKVRTNSSEFHENIIKQRHGSVQAHGHVTFAFENVSRVFTHEVVRNSVGNDMSQESLRYVRLSNIKFWVPAVITKDQGIKKFVNVHPDDRKFKHHTVELDPVEIFERVVRTCEWAQQALAEYYEIEGMTSFEEKKKLTSAFRRVAPEGLATGIGMTFSIRSLRWIIEQRTSSAAEEEIRVVFDLVAKIAYQRWPQLFVDFEQVDTGDGLVWHRPKYSKI
jgi:thymidylate synthase (FAD)